MATAPAGRNARYREIENWLREQCAANPAGHLLPAEVELAERFGVSRMTARQAYQALANEGMVERRRGIGTTVAPPRLHRAEATLYSFTDDMLRRNLTPSSKLLVADVITSPGDAAVLKLPADAPIVRIHRIRYADGSPIAFEQVALPGDFAGVLEFDLETGSLHAAMAQLGRRMAKASGFVSARLATPIDCTLLDLVPPAALLVESRLITDVDGRPTERAETAYVGSRWALDTGPYLPAAMDAARAAPMAPASGPRAAATT